MDLQSISNSSANRSFGTSARTLKTLLGRDFAKNERNLNSGALRGVLLRGLLKTLNSHYFCIGILLLLSTVTGLGQPGPTPSPGAFGGWSTNGPAVYRLLVQSTQTVPSPDVTYRPPPPLPLELRREMLTFRAAANLTVRTQYSKTFDHVLPESLNWLVWTNFIAHTNGKNTVIWSVRSRVPGQRPVVQWNPNSLLWGMKGFTAISPCGDLGVYIGQGPVTALTRRHGYTLGHAMGEDRIGTAFAGKKVWLLSSQNKLFEMTIKREIVRTAGTSRRDYTILIFDRDLPQDIETMRVTSTQEIYSVPHCKYGYVEGGPCVVFQTEQTGNVSAGVPGFTVNVGKGGDSGSPNMLPMPGELVFFSGRTTSGPSPEMQTDMDTLCRLEGLDPRLYQLRWFDLSAYPTYSSQ